MNRLFAARHQQGVTLVEASAVLAVVSVLLGTSLPEFEKTRQRHHLEGTAAQMETDLHLARSQAVAMNRTVRLSFGGTGNQACYAIHTGGAGDCDCAAGSSGQCTNGAQLLASRRLDGKLPVAISSNSGSLAFSAHFGTVTPTATMRVENAAGDEIRVIVNVTGRVRSCSPTAGLSAFQSAC